MQSDLDLAILFQDAVSAPRLTSYLEDGDENLVPAVSRYVWNTALCEALYPSVHGVEVAFRNIIDRRMQVLHGEYWFDDPAVLIVKDHDKAVARAR